jgi:hypothetical protein
MGACRFCFYADVPPPPADGSPQPAWAFYGFCSVRCQVEYCDAEQHAIAGRYELTRDQLERLKRDLESLPRPYGPPVSTGTAAAAEGRDTGGPNDAALEGLREKDGEQEHRRDDQGRAPAEAGDRGQPRLGPAVRKGRRQKGPTQERQGVMPWPN